MCHRGLVTNHSVTRSSHQEISFFILSLELGENTMMSEQAKAET